MAYPNQQPYMQQPLNNGPPSNTYAQLRPTVSQPPLQFTNQPTSHKGLVAYPQPTNPSRWNNLPGPPQMNGEVYQPNVSAPPSLVPNVGMPGGIGAPANNQVRNMPPTYQPNSPSSTISNQPSAYGNTTSNLASPPPMWHGQPKNGISAPPMGDMPFPSSPMKPTTMGSPAVSQQDINKGASAFSSPPLPGPQFKSFTPPLPPGSQSPGMNPQGPTGPHSSRSTPTHPPSTLQSSLTQPPPVQTVGGQQVGPPTFPGQQVSSPYHHQQYPTHRPPVTASQRAPLAPPPLPGQQYRPHSGVQSPPNMPGPPVASQNTRPPPAIGQPYTSQHDIRPPPLAGHQYNPLSSVPQSTAPLAAGGFPPPPGMQPPGLQPPGMQPPGMQPPGIQPPGLQPPGMQPPGIQPPGLQPPAGGQQPPGAYPSQNSMSNITNSFGNMAMGDAQRPVNIMQETRLLPVQKLSEAPMTFQTKSDRGMLIPPNRKNCSPEVLRCTLKSIPATQNLLTKVKLPFGLVVHPFKDLNSLPVISAGTIVRCKRCRTYVNPFVTFLDERRWRCNMCFGVNETPEEFLHHPVTKSYGEPHTRPECTNSTIEFIAPQEYMLRPPQPAVYLFLMDVSHSAIESGYLQVVCDVLLDCLDRLPGDARTRIGFLTYNGTIHFYRLGEGLAQPQMIIVSDIDDVFLPTPENLLVNLRESKALIQDLLHQLPIIHTPDVEGEVDTYSALGAALDVAKKLMSPFGGRVTVFQQAIPSIGPGKLSSREDPGSRSGQATTSSLNPATDYYKKMALDCSAHQVAIDVFFFNSQYIDIATISCASRFSAGDLHYYPSLHTVHNPMEVERLTHDLERYLTRKIGFEAVMRIRCTKGLSIHTFHGNFFVRSTDLLSLANVSPDSGYAVNLSIEESLSDYSAACVQAALLYTTSKGERRIRVHTMCIPVVKTAAEVINSVDCMAVVSLLAKMGVDRAVTASLSDARDALTNAVIDPLKAYKETLPQNMATGGVYVPQCLRLFPLYVQAMLKHPAFRLGTSTRLDQRVFAMINFKMQPASYFMQDIHPDLYRVDDLNEEGALNPSEVSRTVPQPNLLPLSAESLSQSGTFLLDCGWMMYMLVGRQTSQAFIKNVLGAPQFSNLEDPMYLIPEQENENSKLFHNFLEWLQDSRPHHAPLRVIRDDSRDRHLFFSHLHQDRTESSMSLQEFLMHVQQKLA